MHRVAKARVLHQHRLHGPGDGGGLRNQQPTRKHTADAGNAQAALRELAQCIEAPDLSAAQDQGFLIGRCYGFHVAKRR